MIPNEIFPPNLLKVIIRRFSQGGTRIYNHSIAAFYPCRTKHMSAWAAEIDNLCHEHDILFVQAAGNIRRDSINNFRLGILQHISAGRRYPDYLLEDSCRIPSPSQSLQALTIGSICLSDYKDLDRNSFGTRDWPSSFSASGPGLWGITKPDVVEYGGDWVIDKGNPPSLTCPPEVCPELVRTSPGPAYARDSLGTSFAAPKVTHIAAILEKTLPQEPCLLYRALIVQSARWPQWATTLPIEQSEKVFRFIGYGHPNLERATTNNHHRVTLITSGVKNIHAREADIYQIQIPEKLRTVGEEHDILIEVTLSYSAKPRRTRRNLRGYLSVWLDWKTSRIGETADSFANRVLHEGSSENTDGEESIPWKVGERSNWGQVHGVSRSAGTLQKDWATIKSYQLPSCFCIAVIGHRGWDKDPISVAKYSLVVSFEAINKDIEVYQLIKLEIEPEIEIELNG